MRSRGAQSIKDRLQQNSDYPGGKPELTKCRKVSEIFAWVIGVTPMAETKILSIIIRLGDCYLILTVMRLKYGFRRAGFPLNSGYPKIPECTTPFTVTPDDGILKYSNIHD